MLHTKSVFIFLFLYIEINAVPPEACFAKFRWEDCGRPPTRVLYYWKPGSRCEVGTWRGCLPNLNMFHDEYECVATCIFSVRAQPPDYHAIISKEEDEDTQTEVTEPMNVTSSSTDDNQTTVADVDANTTVADAGNSTDATDVEVNNATTTVETNGTAVETGNATDVAGGNATATNSTN